MRIALKVDVSSLRGAEKGVSKLLTLFGEYKVKASFFFNGSPSDSGVSLKRAWNKTKGLVGGDASTDGISILAASMQSVMEAGHEIGLRAHDGGEWSKKAANADSGWTRHQLALAVDFFEEVLGHAPRMFAAADFQVNPHLFPREEKLMFKFASDTRGKHPFYPVYQKVNSSCPQIPVTLPTLTELLKHKDVSDDNVHEYMYAESRHVMPAGHVYMARAEYEGLNYLDYMEKMLVMWKGQEGSIRTLGDIYKELNLETLPRHQVGWGQVEGNDRHLAMQSIKET